MDVEPMLYLGSGEGDQMLGAGKLIRPEPKEQEVWAQLVLEFGSGIEEMKSDGRRESILSKAWRLWVVQVGQIRLGQGTRCGTRARYQEYLQRVGPGRLTRLGHSTRLMEPACAWSDVTQKG